MKRIEEEPNLTETEEEEADDESTFKFRSKIYILLAIAFSFCLFYCIYYFFIVPKIEEIRLTEEIRLKEEIRLTEELRLKEETRLKEEIEKKIFNNAYIALMKIEAAAGSEIDHQKYFNLIDSAILELNLIKDNNSIRLYTLNKIFDCYQAVIYLWSSIDVNENSKNQRLEKIRRRSELEQDTLKRNFDTRIDDINHALQLALKGIDKRNLVNAEIQRNQVNLKYWDEESKAVIKNTQEKLAIEAKTIRETAKVINDNYVDNIDKKESIQLLWEKASKLLREYETF